MHPYLDLLREVRASGRLKQQRAVLASTGTRPGVMSLFGRQLRLNLADGFPLVTTKRMPFKAVAHELLWFLSGSTNIDYLRQHNVKIWDEWADASGELGPVYGKQWRHWQGPQGEVDQVARLIEGIRRVKDNPQASEGRRLILTAWNPADMPDPRVPTGCHTFSQYEVFDGKLSCHLYQRSADMFLGVPFNIASYALLTHMLAQVTGLGVGDYVHSFGDAHIYENHLAAVDEQLSREPLPLPRLELDATERDIDDFRIEHMRVVDYRHHPALRGEVAV